MSILTYSNRFRSFLDDFKLGTKNEVVVKMVEILSKLEYINSEVGNLDIIGDKILFKMEEYQIINIMTSCVLIYPHDIYNRISKLPNIGLSEFMKKSDWIKLPKETYFTGDWEVKFVIDSEIHDIGYRHYFFYILYNDTTKKSAVIFHNKMSPRPFDTGTKKKPSEIKIGRIIRRIFQEQGLLINDTHIEAISTEFDVYNKLIEEGFANVRVIDGEELREKYLYNKAMNSGTIGRSCMRFDYCQSYLKIYTENPDVCKMAILERDGTVYARALLWNTIEGDKIIDRIYSDTPTSSNIIARWALTNGYVNCNNHSVKLNNIIFDKYPYIDTFNYIDMINGKLYSKCPDGMNLLRATKADGTLFRQVTF